MRVGQPLRLTKLSYVMQTVTQNVSRYKLCASDSWVSNSVFNIEFLSGDNKDRSIIILWTELLTSEISALHIITLCCFLLALFRCHGDGAADSLAASSGIRTRSGAGNMLNLLSTPVSVLAAQIGLKKGRTIHSLRTLLSFICKVVRIGKDARDVLCFLINT